MRVIIAGGGIGGLTLALSLHQVGIEAIVCESVRTPEPLGVGILLQPAAMREMSALGLAADLQRMGNGIQATRMYTAEGMEVLTTAEGVTAGYRWPKIGLHRGRLQMLLLEQARLRLGPEKVRTGMRLTSWRTTPEGVEAAPNTWTDPVIERPESRTLPADVAQLRMLDKMSGAAETFEIAVGETAERGRLSIHLSACRAQPPELPPDAFAWLRITDLREEAPRFEGWMIASNPSLSALDHQRYDVWVLSCSTRSAGADSESEKKSASR